MKFTKKLIVMMILTVFMISTVAATVHAVSMPKADKQIESKEKVAKVKVTFNANGGKIGSKKTISTSVKKGAKLNKLATAKRSGYTLLGWHTKKTGGKKISKATKVSKEVIFYAHWKKKSRALNAEEKKLVGFWQQDSTVSKDEARKSGHWIEFKNDGTYKMQYYLKMPVGSLHVFTHKVNQNGQYKVVGDKIFTSNVLETSTELPTGTYSPSLKYVNKPVKEETWQYKFASHHPGSDSITGNYLWHNRFPKALGGGRWEGYIKN